MPATIFVVEDEEKHQKLFRTILELDGHAVLTFRDGITIEHNIDEHHPDLIIMDIQLPERSGVDIVRDLKASSKYRSIPIIAVTAFAMRNDKERILQSGCDEYMAKPFHTAELQELVRKYVGK